MIPSAESGGIRPNSWNLVCNRRGCEFILEVAARKMHCGWRGWSGWGAGATRHGYASQELLGARIDPWNPRSSARDFQ